MQRDTQSPQNHYPNLHKHLIKNSRSIKILRQEMYKSNPITLDRKMSIISAEYRNFE